MQQSGPQQLLMATGRVWDLVMRALKLLPCTRNQLADRQPTNQPEMNKCIIINEELHTDYVLLINQSIILLLP